MQIMVQPCVQYLYVYGRVGFMVKKYFFVELALRLLSLFLTLSLYVSKDRVGRFIIYLYICLWS